MQSERKPSKTTEVMVGMLPVSTAENAALLATAGFAPGPASTSIPSSSLQVSITGGGHMAFNTVLCA